jgi:hypothetical protein
MGRRCEKNRIEVTEDNVADVVYDDWDSRESYCTNNKLAILPELIE